MRYLLICALAIFAQAQAGPAAAHVTFQPLARITNDRNADLETLGVLLESGRLVGLRFDTINGKTPHESDFSIADMRTGVVLDGDEMHQAIILRGLLNSTAGSADVTVTYLSNGLIGTRKDCRADLVRDEEGRWHIVNIYDHQQVDRLVVRTWTLGISTIKGICRR